MNVSRRLHVKYSFANYAVFIMICRICTVKTTGPVVARTSGIVRLKPAPVRAASGTKVKLNPSLGAAPALHNGQSSKPTTTKIIKLSVVSAAQGRDLSINKPNQASQIIKLNRPVSLPVTLTPGVNRSNSSDVRTTVQRTGHVRSVSNVSKQLSQQANSVNSHRLSAVQNNSSFIQIEEKQHATVANAKHVINRTLHPTSTCTTLAVDIVPASVSSNRKPTSISKISWP